MARVDVQETTSDDERFLSCTNCGSAFPIDSMFEDEDCYQCGGELAVRLMPLNQGEAER